MREQTEKLECFALVELMGRQKIVGKLTETVLAGGAFLRVDVPASPPEKALTQFYSPAAIYRITPIDEELARKLMQSIRQEPVSRWDLPQIADKVETTPTNGDGWDDDGGQRDM